MTATRAEDLAGAAAAGAPRSPSALLAALEKAA